MSISLIRVGGDNPTILISVRPSNNVTEFCGLCGSRSGDLLKADGSIVDRNDVDQTQEFARSYIVEPSEQILRPQRKECGKSKTILSLLFASLYEHLHTT